MKKIFLVFLLVVLIPLVGFAASDSITVSSAADTWTDWMVPKNMPSAEGENVNIDSPDDGTLFFFVTGTGSMTTTLQVAFDFGTAANDIETYTGNTQQMVINYIPGVSYRVGVKADDYASGSKTIQIMK